jgi:hypothetical protein
MRLKICFPFPSNLICVLCVSAVSFTSLTSGCGQKQEPAVPQGPSMMSNAPTVGGEPVPPGKEITEIVKLSVTSNSEFVVRAEKRSLEVVQHFDAELAKSGWKKRTPKDDKEAGQRKWMSTGSKVGPTEAYDAAWVNPKTGRVAILNLWHSAESPGVQQGTFELFDKGSAPL